VFEVRTGALGIPSLHLEHASDKISIRGLVRICLIFECGKCAFIHMVAIHDLRAEMRPIGIVAGKEGAETEIFVC